MKAWIIGFVCFCVLFIPFHAHADSKPTSIQTLTDLANKIYQAVSEQQLETGANELDNFKKTWAKISDTDESISPVAVRTIAAQEDNLDKALTMDVGEKKLNDTSVEFRLAVDALTNSKHPLWMGMKDNVLGAFIKIQQDVKAGDDQKFQVDLNQFLDVYQMIYPSITIDVQPDVIKKLDSQINHVTNNRMTIVQDQKTHIPHLKTIHEELNQLFGGTEDASGFVTYPGVMTPSILIGGLIILTLLYVVWRKYRGEHKTNTHMTVTK